MTADRWARIHDLFELCLDQPPESRASFLASQSVEPDIRSEVEKLLQQDRIAGSFLAESPDLVKELRTAPRSQFSPGDRLGHRFELLRLIGRGGMGEVYAALDVDLEEQVAIKVLHSDLLTDAGATQRFRRELQLARKVTHPNVCRLFDLGRHSTPQGDVFFLTMELIEGETLAERLRRVGRFTVDEARPIVEQLLHGLAAAHQAGIIHRDLKPSNVMLTGPRAVIMDFGLARRDTSLTDGSLTSSGKVLGTLDYMAPEQLRGEPVTERTDLYALGLILYEMLTGTRPFARADSVAGALARLTESPAKLPARAPKNWARTAAALLEPDPQHRPASAPQVLEHLRGPGPRRRLTRRQLATAAAISFGGLSLYWGGSRLIEHNRIRLPEGAAVFLNELQNNTDKPEMGALQELIRASLQQSSWINLLDSNRLREVLTQMGKTGVPTAEAIREAAWRVGVHLIVFTSVTAIGSAYSLNVSLESRGSSPGSPRTQQIQAFSFQDQRTRYSAAHDASVWIRTHAGESASALQGADRLPEDVTTPSWEALTFLSKADQLARDLRRDDALLMLDSALDRDPEFTLAAMRKGDLLMSMNRQREALGAWDRAMALLPRRAITRREELRTRGMYAFDRGERAEADRYFATWALEYPQDARALLYRTIPLLEMGRAAEAIRNLERAAHLDPTSLSIQGQLVNSNLAAENYPASLAAIARMESLGGAQRAAFKRGIHDYCAGDYSAALRRFADLRKIDSARKSASLHLAMVLMDVDLPAKAIAALGPALPTTPPAALFCAAYAHLRLGDTVQAVRSARLAWAQETGPTAVMHYGTILSRAGMVNDARAAIQLPPSLANVRSYQIAVHRVAGEIALHESREADAASEFQSAANLEPPMSPRPYLARLKKAGSATLDQIHRQVLLCPALNWIVPLDEEPGCLGDSIRSAGSSRPGIEQRRVNLALAKSWATYQQ